MKQIRMICYVYLTAALYFSVRIILAQLVFHKPEPDFAFHIVGFWACLLLAYLFFLGWKIVEGATGCRAKENYHVLLPLLILLIVTSAVSLLKLKSSGNYLFIVTEMCVGTIVLVITYGRKKIIKLRELEADGRK